MTLVILPNLILLALTTSGLIFGTSLSILPIKDLILFGMMVRNGDEFPNPGPPQPVLRHAHRVCLHGNLALALVWIAQKVGIQTLIPPVHQLVLTCYDLTWVLINLGLRVFFWNVALAILLMIKNTIQMDLCPRVQVRSSSEGRGGLGPDPTARRLEDTPMRTSPPRVGGIPPRVYFLPLGRGFRHGPLILDVD